MANDEIIEFVQRIADRFFSERDISHILSWYAGTLEYLIHVYSYSIGCQHYTALNTEIPYITSMPNPGTKSNIKWADGAFLLKDGLGIFLEVKTIVYKDGKIGATIKKVPLDMAALLSARWVDTLAHKPDRYTDPKWWELRHQIKEPWGVQITLIHGSEVPLEIENNINSFLQSGITTLENKIGNSCLWLNNLKTCFEKQIYSRFFNSETARGCFLAWAGKISTN